MNCCMKLFIAMMMIPLIAAGQDKIRNYHELPETLNDQITFDINRISLLLENDGTFGKVGFAYYPLPGNITFLFDGGPVLSGLINGELRTAWNAESALANELQPGIWGQDPDDALAKWYVVNASDGFGSQAYVDWADAVILGAAYQDLNNNGSYQPMIDRPDIWGDRTAWTPYNDGTTVGQRNPFFGTLPIGVEFQQTSWVFNRGDELDDVIYFRYRLINRNTTIADSLIFSLWSDPDIGDAIDDLVGCDPENDFAFCYNDSDDPWYGINPPAFGVKLIQGPVVPSSIPEDSAFVYRGPAVGVDTVTGARNLGMSSFLTYVGADPTMPSPTTAQRARNYQIGGLLPDGQPIDPTQFGVINGGTPDPKFFFSGDPVTNGGWIDNMPVDRKMLVNTGPFTMAPGDTQEIIYAIVVNQGVDALNSITTARQTAELAADLLPNLQPTAIDQGEVLPQEFVLLENFPNPFNPQTTFRFVLPGSGNVQLEIFNLSGQRVATLLNEFRVAGEHRVLWTASADGQSLPSGNYFARLTVAGQSLTRKVLLLK